MHTQIALPRLLYIGGGACRKIGDVLRVLGLSRPIVVTDPVFFRQNAMQELLRFFREAGRPSPPVFAEATPDPTSGSIASGLRFLKQANADAVIGFGGGSSIDTAKAIASLAVHGGEMRDYKAPHQQDSPGLPVIAIPSTAGTGSEATRFTIITDDDTGEKMLCIGLAYLPIAAIVDYELTLTKPARLTADTGVDALTHALEAYVSRRANPFADGFALTAMKQIWVNLPVVYFEPHRGSAREAMMLAATQAGIAFSNSSVALVHGMSRPIGARFHVPHGLSNAMLLPAVTEFSVKSAGERYATCARTMGLTPPEADAESAGAILVKALRELNRRLEVPGPQQLGISAEEWEKSLATMAEQALASGSPANNPRVPSVEEIVDLYREVWRGG
jgi:alcohol dehydrogenase class IV